VNQNWTIGAAEVGVLFPDSVLSGPSLEWDGAAIERRTVRPSEKPEVTVGHHFVILWDQHVAEGESKYRRGQFSPYRKYPNSITTCLPGVRPAARNRSKHEVIVCSMDPAFLYSVEEEMEERPQGAIHPLYGQYDTGLRELVLLLLEEAEVNGIHGKLYLDSLSTALATRLIFVGRSARQPQIRRASPLPRRAFLQVVERMRTDLGTNLTLSMLAAESGYSRAHFLRMFRATTGQSPHRYLLELRLNRAHDMIADGSAPLSDVAYACGFSSQAHLSTAFRAKFRLAPGQYRRNFR
jgi:AraC family transcriptional regulator